MTLWVRFEHGGVEGFGTLDGESVAVRSGDMFAVSEPTGQILALDQLRLLVPVRPGKIVGLWNNFHALATKLGAAVPDTPLYFLKATTSLLAPGGSIRPPAGYDGPIVYEGELGIVVGCRCTNVDEAGAAAAIFGYTCVNDVTASGLLDADPGFAQWTRAKGCDTFGPCGPAIATGLDWSALQVRTLLNGRERQGYPAADMILPPARIVSLLSREMTLEPGDLIACGTSIGVRPMRPGMEVSVVIDGIGTLTSLMADTA